MTNEEFERLFEQRVEMCRKVLIKKGEEYASDTDRLHNFGVAAKIQGVTRQQALGGMLAKHIVSIFDLIREGNTDEFIWEEKLGDALNYLFLLDAIIVESRPRHDHTTVDRQVTDMVQNVTKTRSTSA